jgi:hypothetical protein
MDYRTGLTWVCRHWWVPAVSAVVVAGVLVWALWPASQPEQPRARQYIDVNACLLTGPQGLADPQVTPVWQGMQDASLQTHARVSYLSATGPSTMDNVAPYLNGLLQRRCNIVLAVGSPQVAAVDLQAPKYPNVRFLVIGGHATGANITEVSGPAATDVRKQIGRMVASDVGAYK